MPKVTFTYDQHIVQTFRASCEVPQEVIDKEEVEQYLDENYCDWDESGEGDINIEYGDRCGQHTIEVEDIEDAES